MSPSRSLWAAVVLGKHELEYVSTDIKAASLVTTPKQDTYCYRANGEDGKQGKGEAQIRRMPVLMFYRTNFTSGQ